MKILQVTQRFNPSVSGSQYHVYRISRELVKLGNDVTVLSSTSMHNKDVRGFSTSRPFTLKSNCPDLPRFEIIDGIKVYRFEPIFQFWMYMINPVMFNFLINSVNKWDIVHCHVYMSAEADMAGLVCKLKNVPFIFTAHDLITSHNGYIKPLKRFYDTIGRITLKNANKLIALTPINKSQYESILSTSNKIRIVPNGVDIEKFDNIKSEENNIKSKDNIVLFVGRIVKYKGAQYIIQAIPEIIKDHKNLKFVFVGEDQGYLQYLIDLADSLKVSGRCIFTGLIDDTTLLSYYSKASIFILPSVGEAFGLVALEAIANEIPSILANEGGLNYILSQIGGYPLDMTKDVPRQIAEHVKKILSDKYIDEKTAIRKEILRKNYTWQKIAKDIEDIYTDVIDSI